MTKNSTNLKNILDYSIKNISNDKLLAPIVYNTNIKENIEYCDYILSSLPDNNKIKIYLIKELNNIKIEKAKLGDNFTDLYKDISKMGNYHLKECDLKVGKDEVKTIWKVYLSNKDIIRSEYNYNNSFVFKCNNAFLKSSLHEQKWWDYIQRKANKKPKLEADDKFLLNKTSEVALSSMCGKYWKNVTTFYNVNKCAGISYSKTFDNLNCCYAVIFNNNLYYYIGSTTNISDRVKNHHSNIQKIIRKVIEGGLYYNHDVKTYYNSNILEYFIASEILNGKINIKYFILPLYFCTNYLKDFVKCNPNYELSKGEWILLTSINNLIIKILEQSLIVKFKPKLNTVNSVTIRHFDWDISYLEEYSSNISLAKPKPLVSLYKEYSKTAKFLILTPHLKNIKDKICKTIDIKDIKVEGNTYFTKNGPYSLYLMCRRYSLNKEEVLANINKLHYYEGCILLKQPIIIIPNP